MSRTVKLSRMTNQGSETNTQHIKLAKAIEALQITRRKLEAVEAARHEPIAIIGMGCRYPNGGDTPERFWQNLLAGDDAIVPLPDQRLHDLQGDRASVTGEQPSPKRHGGFLAEVDQFDPAFFGLAPREAVLMDPAHRLLLETAWEALETAAIVPATLFNHEVGVFVGCDESGYIKLCLEQSKDLYIATGNVASAAAGRISYTLGLTGPCISVDTACSSSLAAIHLACQSLRNGECEAALAGGVNLILEENFTTMFANGNMLSKQDRCHTFDAAADGYVRGEGCGMMVLKRLSDAQADNDPIVAVIRGSAINQDGPSGGLTVPNGPSQERVIRRALADAGVQPEQIGYVEAHGTGTPLGDPIEMGALSAVFQQRDQPLYVGSVKTNIGHLEFAAGIAGLMKLVLSLQHELIPPHLHLQTPNPHIDWATSPVQVPTTATLWANPADGTPRIGGVSSFGFSGTNAHVIVAEAPAIEPVVNEVARSAHLLTIAAKSEPALRAYAQRYADFLTDHPDLNLSDLCYTSHVGRSHYSHRLALASSSTAALQAQLADYLAGAEATGLTQGEVAPLQPCSKIAFLFTGQGAQYVGMGRELYETSPSFRSMVEHCDKLFQQETGKSLLAILYPETGNQEQQSPITKLLDETTYTQPALFVLEYALAMLWQEWGVQPSMLLGHSVGELVAACVAGVFSLEDALKLVAARGRLMGALPQDGTMVAVKTTEAHVQTLLADHAEVVSIAAVNGPDSVVISGQRAAVLAIAAQLDADGIKTQQLQVSHAFHSPLMAPMLEEFRRVAQSIAYHPPKIPIVANVTGDLQDAKGSDTKSLAINTPDYWVRHVREAVRFADGVATLYRQGIDILLELGPKPTLTTMAKAIFERETPFTVEAAMANLAPVDSARVDSARVATPLMLASLRKGQHEWRQLLSALGALYVRGVPIDWQGVEENAQRHKITLPTYPFQRKRYWITDEKYQQRVNQVETNMTTQTNGTRPEGRVLAPTSQITGEAVPAPMSAAPMPVPPMSAAPNTAQAAHNGQSSAAPAAGALAQSLQQILQQNNAEVNLQIDELKGLRFSLKLGTKEQPSGQSTAVGTVNRATPPLPAAPQTVETVATDAAPKRQLTPLPHAAAAVPSPAPAPLPTPAPLPAPVPVPAQAQPAAPAPVQSALPSVSQNEIMLTLKQTLADILYIDDLYSLNEYDKLIDQGMDSVTGVEFINVINAKFSLELKAVVIYDYPTIRELAAYIVEELAQQGGAPTAGQAQETQPTEAIPPAAGQDVAQAQPTNDADRTQLRDLLLKVSKGEMTPQESKAQLDKLKANSAPATHTQIRQLVQEQMIDILPDLAGKTIEPTATFDDLGFDSMEQAEVLIKTMETLHINAPRATFAQAKTIGELVELLANHAAVPVA